MKLLMPLKALVFSLLLSISLMLLTSSYSFAQSSEDPNLRPSTQQTAAGVSKPGFQADCCSAHVSSRTLLSTPSNCTTPGCSVGTGGGTRPGDGSSGSADTAQ